VQWVAYTALKNYKYVKEANRIACKYLDVVTKNYINPIPSVYTKDGKTKTRPVHLIWEKYTPDGCLNDADYPCNEMLGWTGGVFVELYMSVK